MVSFREVTGSLNFQFLIDSDTMLWPASSQATQTLTVSEESVFFYDVIFLQDLQAVL